MSIATAEHSICEQNQEFPHDFLGLHQEGDKYIIRTYEPYAEKVDVYIGKNKRKTTRSPNGFFYCELKSPPKQKYQLDVSYPQHSSKKYDAYSFLPSIGALDLHLINEGNHLELYNALGSQIIEHEGVKGVRFALWAPEAKSISVIGNFNGWNKAIHPMRKLLGTSGIWELFIPELPEGEYYKFAIKTKNGEALEKQDPLGKFCELRPGTASIVWQNNFAWNDQHWIDQRTNNSPLNKATSIYELHLGSWNHPDLKFEGEFPNYREIAQVLGQYIQDMGYTHIELMPITEHPFDPSWGYQTTGYFAPSSRFGKPSDFAYFVDHLHSLDIGVIVDWVPAHFPTDAFALGKFDGTSVYEHDNLDEGYHPDWNTYIFNYGRTEVANFLIASALFWLKEFHIDGLRVDAVASMLYRDYSRNAGQWRPNKDGGRENYEAIEFMKRLNLLAHEHCPGTMIIAEESTAFPKVSKPIYDGGLGYTMKWNMGWMNDTLKYFETESIHRKYHQNQLTFSLVYAFNENFVLPLSHDEVVHGKGSLIQKMPGDTWQKFANLRCLYAFMYAHPGKKLLFMGSEIAQWHEWSEEKSLDWSTLSNENHKGIQDLTKKLNHLYKDTTSLWEVDFSHEGFEWVDTQDHEQSILSFIRKDASGNELLCVMNLTPVPRDSYTIGVNKPGEYQIVLNTDKAEFGGSDYLKTSTLSTNNQSFHDKQQSLTVNLPPLAVIYLKKN